MDSSASGKDDGPSPVSSGGRKPLARVKLHPAVIVIGALAVAAGGKDVWLLDPGWAPSVVFRSLGMGLGALGLLTLVLSYGAMARARATINPRRHTRRIVSNGTYRFSRNPIYLGWSMLILGGGLERLSLIPMLVAPLMIGLLHRAVVLPEEEYLENTFGEEYLRYKRSVRRWL